MAQGRPAAAVQGSVFPQTGNRLPSTKAEVAPPATVADAVGAIRRHGSGGDLRWKFTLGRALAELAILATARELNQPFEWSVHETEAIGWGLDPKVIDVVRHRRPLRGLNPTQAAIVQVTRESVGGHRISPDTHARALKVLGEANLVDTVLLSANYVATAARLTAINQQMPAEMVQWLPLPFKEPTDIHPDSRSRLPFIKQQPLGNTSLYSREIAPYGTGPAQLGAHQGARGALEAHLGPRLLNLAILVTAREHDQQYQWTMTEVAARRGGLEPAIIDVVRDRRPVTGLGEKEGVIIAFGRELFSKGPVRADTYAQALKVFGETDLTDLSNFMGQQSANATILNAFDQRLPAGQQPLLPMR